jgi:hypothetical protein
MKVCFLDDLISSGLIPEDKKAGILENQAKNAGRPVEDANRVVQA